MCWQRENERWAMENERDSTFADMYLHPQEVDYTVDTLLQWTDTVKDLGKHLAARHAIATGALRAVLWSCRG